MAVAAEKFLDEQRGSVGYSTARCTDELVNTAASLWMQTAGSRDNWTYIYEGGSGGGPAADVMIMKNAAYQV